MRLITSLGLAVSLASAVFAKPPVPRPADPLTIVDSSGQPRTLASYRGKVVLVQFLSTTCGHCQIAARMYSKLETELAPRGFSVLGVAFNEQAQGKSGLIDQFVNANSLAFPVGSASMQTVLKYLGISAVERFVVPQILIVDRSGVIRAQSDATGSAQLQQESYVRTFVEGLLQPAGAASARR